MSAALVEGGYEDTVYGAVSFREADPTAGAFDYTVHVRPRSARLTFVVVPAHVPSKQLSMHNVEKPHWNMKTWYVSVHKCSP